MMKIDFSKSFKKSYKKLSKKDKELFSKVSLKLANDEILEPKYRDHALKGDYVGFRECHLKPDLLLIYKKQDDKLILYCLDIGSHSELF
ncbi:addiction module toxin RelE [Helicobacter enhydrae]|uniref:Addiction module toxin RelE n=2 Tax=Helicobacter enhydrae TaxID=222136 RepID=A0A1B1U4G8_9HELI|nr:type II toxin-antitoxin system YafQ family toxin [Helicobacter enhydrae]ANV97648.1 addiction module toxin RelE [Helicobacter enhydrae]